MVSHFLPVKITKKEYATRLMDGEVFMNPLSVFTSPIFEGEISIEDTYRNDPLEGIVSGSFVVPKNPYFAELDDEIQKQIKGIIHIDSSSLPFFKLFCLYRLEYDCFTDKFWFPDQRIRQFGDTAVVICDFNEFLKRLINRIRSQFGDMFVFMCDRVKLLEFGHLGKIVPIFEKTMNYHYQNELRLAFVELGEQEGKLYNIKKHSEPQIFNIGDIRDIAYEMPIDNLISLSGLAGKRYRFPNSEDPNRKFYYDYCVEETRKLIKNYTKPAISNSECGVHAEKYALIRVDDRNNHLLSTFQVK